jgi:hypothetical protein
LDIVATRRLLVAACPAVVVVSLACVLLVTQAAVAPGDVVVFLGYYAVCLALPGTLVWRLVHADSRRGLLEDVVLGTVVAHAFEVPLYLLGRAVGVPLLSLAFPIAVLAYALVSPRGRRLWPPASREGRTLTWPIAGLTVYVVLVLARVWTAAPLTDEAMRSPYVDEPFHLALVGDLKHHVPGQMPWVEGIPLHYHWLVHGQVASASSVTGIEPAALIRVLSTAGFVVLALLAVIVAANRLSGRSWPGLVAGGLLFVGMPPDVFGWTPAGAPFAAGLWNSVAVMIASPTHGFALLLTIPLLVLVHEALRDDRLSPARWLMAALLMVVVAGAKSSALPPVLAGLAFVTGFAVLRHRSVRVRIPATLLATGVGAFLLAFWLIYGGGSRDLAVDPSGTSWVFGRAFGLIPPGDDGPAAVHVVLTASLALALIATAAGALGLLTQGGWRLPEHHFLVVTALAAVVATFVFTGASVAQAYFARGGTAALAMACALGLSRLVGPLRPRAGGLLLVAGLGTAVALGTAALSARQIDPDADPVAEALRALVIPQAVAVGAIAALTLGAVLLGRRRRWPADHATAVALCVTLGLSLVSVGASARGLIRTWPGPAVVDAPLISDGGIEAARELREMSSPDDLVATNAHCLRRPHRGCDRRNFWVAAYAERRILVEGWAYVPDEVRQGTSTSNGGTTTHQPFWDPAKLSINDAAFESPSDGTVQRLRDEYGVRWLFVDRRYPHNLAGLRRVADLRFQRGDYAVLEISGAQS